VRRADSDLCDAGGSGVFWFLGFFFWGGGVPFGGREEVVLNMRKRQLCGQRTSQASRPQQEACR